MKQRSHIIWLVSICLLVTVIAFNIENISIHYHRWMMAKARDRMISSSRSTGLLVGNPIESYGKHRDALVRLGYFEKREFTLKHVMSGSSEFKDVWKLMNERFPKLGDFSSPYNPGTPCVIDVWTTSNEMLLVEQFIADVDRQK
jgi:hypothetical protein